jgi:hypothetical protein
MMKVNIGNEVSSPISTDMGRYVGLRLFLIAAAGSTRYWKRGGNIVQRNTRSQYGVIVATLSPCRLVAI